MSTLDEDGSEFEALLGGLGHKPGLFCARVNQDDQGYEGTEANSSALPFLLPKSLTQKLEERHAA